MIDMFAGGLMLYAELKLKPTIRNHDQTISTTGT